MISPPLGFILDELSPGLWLPGATRAIFVGDRIPEKIQNLAEGLGLAFDAPTLSANVVKLLAILAVARAEASDEVTLSELACKGWPSRPEGSLAKEMSRHLVSAKSGSGSVWPERGDTKLLQIKADRRGKMLVTAGPYRLNPHLYPLTTPLHLLRTFIATGVLPRGLSTETILSFEDLFLRSNALISSGQEAVALDLLLSASSAPGILKNGENRIAFLMRLTQLEMQLGRSKDCLHHALQLTKIARSMDDKVVYAEAFHIQALSHRQRGEIAKALDADQKALSVLSTGNPSHRRELLEVRRSLAESYSVLLMREEGRSARFVTKGMNDKRWGGATRMLHHCIQEAEALGDRKQISHTYMRLACHRLRQLRRTAEHESEILKAHDLFPEMPLQAQVIFARETATEILFRARCGIHLGAVAALRLCEQAARTNGYTHQVKLVAEALDRANIPRDELLQEESWSIVDHFQSPVDRLPDLAQLMLRALRLCRVG